MDDGSTDGGNRIVAQYPITLLRVSNRKLAGARNAGVMNSHGDAILPLDADDKIAPDYLEKTVPLLTEGVGFVSTDMQRFGKQDQLLPAKIKTPKEALEYNEIPVTSLISRKALLQVGGWNSTMNGYEDWNLWIDILKRGWKMAVVNEPLFFHRITFEGLNAEADANRERLVERIRSLHTDIN